MAEATRPAAFDIKDPMAVLAYVLASLPERVTVYPTENYYYFKFVHAGVPIAGNLRLDPRDRDKGKVYFAYYEDNADWNKDGFEQALELDGKQNVLVERVEPLALPDLLSRHERAVRAQRRVADQAAAPARSAPTSA